MCFSSVSRQRNNYRMKSVYIFCGLYSGTHYAADHTQLSLTHFGELNSRLLFQIQTHIKSSQLSCFRKVKLLLLCTCGGQVVENDVAKLDMNGCDSS